MGLFEDLKELGVDVDGGLKRIGGNEALYKRLLNTFVKAMKGQQVSPDFDTSDYEDVKERAHAIKGTSGNLSITPVLKESECFQYFLFMHWSIFLSDALYGSKNRTCD